MSWLEKLRVALVLKKMDKNRFWWFGYVMRRYDSEAARLVMEMSLEGKMDRWNKKWYEDSWCECMKGRRSGFVDGYN